MLQSSWVWEHPLHNKCLFGCNACQAAFSEWIWLSHCVLSDIEEWNAHATTDLCEAVTLYLPVRLANHYLTCLGNYHKLKWSNLDVMRCQHASAELLLQGRRDGRVFPSQAPQLAPISVPARIKDD